MRTLMIASAIAAFSIPAVQAAQISITTSSDTVVGSLTPLIVDVVVDRDGGAAIASAFVDVIYDASLLALQDVSLTSALGEIPIDALDTSFPPEMFGSEGIVNIGIESLLADLSAQAESFSLATLTFNAIDNGFSVIELGLEPSLDDIDFFPIADVISLVNSGDIQSIPAPATALLFAPFAAMMLRRRRS
ncbi:MAG: hypothetical protein AAF221_01180 [Pseudomonadota bacterium]